MSEPKYTQGTWDVSTDGASTFVVSGETCIAKVHNYSSATGEKLPTVQNAHLMAAAPDLVKWLQIALKLMQDLREQGGSFDEWAIEEEAAICDVLEQATGESVWPSWVRPEDRDEYEQAALRG